MNTEVPQKIQQLEAERENRLRFRLGHEIGAGAKCFNCAEKCPGLDLHFWRKICKLCKCSKDVHDVRNSNDICDWLQAKLFGEEKFSSDVSSNSRRQYLANDRCPQTILQQIPAHDIDPSLCHELPQDELQMFDDYVKDLKILSVGMVTNEHKLKKLTEFFASKVTDRDPNKLFKKTIHFCSLTKKPSKTGFYNIKGQGEVSKLVINGDVDSTGIERKLGDLKLSATNLKKNDPESIIEIILKTSDEKKCSACCGRLEDNSIVVRIEKSTKLWHPECFKCSTCKQLLVDLMYFYAADNIYCGRDYARVKKIPRCLACDELIFSKEFCSAENNTFHLKHFCCFLCDIPLAGLQYVMDISQGDRNQPICLACYNLHRAHKCAKCNHLIGPEHKGVTIKGNHWHYTDDCFCCSKCQKSVKSSKILTKNKQLFCSKECFL